MAAKKVELHAPIGRDGEGLYTASTKGCFDVIAAATPAVLAQARRGGGGHCTFCMTLFLRDMGDIFTDDKRHPYASFHCAKRRGQEACE